MNSDSDTTPCEICALVRLVWRHKLPIMVGVIVLTGAWIWRAYDTYESRAFYEVGGLPAIEYKRYSALFANEERVRNFARFRGVAAESWVQTVARAFDDKPTLARIVDPVLTDAKADSDLVEPADRDKPIQVAGFKITYDSRSAETSRQAVGFIADFLRDGIIYTMLSDYVIKNLTDARQAIKRSENKLIEARFKVTQYNSRLASLNDILHRHPGAKNMESRQVLSVEKGGSEYLSPLSQVIGVESQLASTTADMLKYERERDQAGLRAEYFGGAKALIDGNQIGETVLAQLEPLKNRILGSKNIHDDMVQEVFNSISIDNLRFRALFSERFRFAYGPTTPVRIQRANIFVVAPLVALASLVLMTLMVAGLDWWRSNRSWITSKQSDP